MLSRRDFLHNSAVAASALLPSLNPPSAGGVTLQPEPSCLKDVVESVTKQTDVSLGVDGPCRWDGVMANVKERSVAKVKADLAELFLYSWTDDPAKPLLTAGARVRGLEQRHRAKTFGGAADRMAAYAALVHQPPEFFQQYATERSKGRFADDPRLRHVEPELFLSRPHRFAIGLWSTLTRDQLAATFAASSHRVYLPWRQMTDEQRKIAHALAEECENPAPGPKYLTIGSAPHSVELVQEFGVVLMGWTWNFGRSSHIKYAQVYRTKPPILLAYNLDFREETPQGKANRGSPYELAPSDPAGERSYSDLDRMPFPGKGFRQSFPMTWPDTFRQLADRLPFALYSDYFTGKSVGTDNSATPREVSGNPAVMPFESMHVGQALDTLCSHVGQVWWRRGDAIFFRSRTWFIDRVYNPPRDVLALCRKQLTEKGKLDRDAVDHLAALTWQEMAGLDNLAQDESARASFRSYFGFHHGLHRLLQVYAGLKPEERDLAFGDGLPASKLGLAQRRAYQDALFIHDGPPEMLSDLPPLRFAQRVINGIPKRRPNLCQIYYAPKPTEQEYAQDVIACMYLPFPLKDPVL